MSLGNFDQAALNDVKKHNDKRYLVKGGTEGQQTVVSIVTFQDKLYFSGIPGGDTVENATNPPIPPCVKPYI